MYTIYIVSNSKLSKCSDSENQCTVSQQDQENKEFDNS